MAYPKICLDGGHGGSDSGAVGNGITEKVYALEVVQEVKRHLERHPVTVILTRINDSYVGLSERANIANRNNVDCFVSIHCNSATPSASGFETFTYSKGKYEIALAEAVHGQIIADGLYSNNRGIKQENFAVLRETSMSAILVELAFLSNVTDSGLLKNYQKEYAKAVAKGILKYLGVAWIEERPYGTREVYVNNKLTCTSNKVSDILKAVEDGLSTTAKIEIIM